MINQVYLPEGSLLYTAENREYITSHTGLARAMNEGKILESTALLCDSDLSLHVDLYGIRGIIPREEAVYCRRGEEMKDIAVITRVGKPVCFKVIDIEDRGGEPLAILSRRTAQAECIHRYLSCLCPGDIVPAKVTHLENFGAFVDIGCGVPSLLSVDSISVSRIAHPSDRLSVGDSIHVVVRAIDRLLDRIFVSMRELLGTWEENAASFEVGQTVAGIVRSVESYGIFVELSPNLAGLAELREGSSDRQIATPGSYAAVYIKNIIPEKMKVKLVLVDAYSSSASSDYRFEYFETKSHIDKFVYSPSVCDRVIMTDFADEI